MFPCAIYYDAILFMFLWFLKSLWRGNVFLGLQYFISGLSFDVSYMVFDRGWSKVDSLRVF